MHTSLQCIFFSLINHFIMQYSFLSFNVDIVLKFTLSDMSITASSTVCTFMDYFFNSFTFNLCISLALKWISSRRHIDRSWASHVALVVKSRSASVEDITDVGLIPGSGRSLVGGHDNRPQYSYLKNSMDSGVEQVTANRVPKKHD